MINTKRDKMLKESRENLICKEINRNGSASIEDLMAVTQSSRSTVIRDINNLNDRNMIKKVRGGAIMLSDGKVEELPFSQRQDLFLEEKQRIVRKARQYIFPNETILLNGGTTVYELAKLLKDIDPLYVATNDLMSATILSEYKNVDLIVLGGALRKKYMSLNGFFTEYMLSHIHADKVIMGIDAIDMKMGLMNFSVDEINTNKKMIESSNTVIVVCDHSKFEKVAFVNFCNFDSVDILITGKESDPEKVAQLKAIGIEVVLV